MTDRMTTRPPWAAGTTGVIAAVVAMGVFLLSACTGGAAPSPSTSTSASSTPSSTSSPAAPSTPPSEQDQDIEAAKEAFVAYVATDDAVQKDAMRDWQTKIMPLLSGDEFRQSRQSFYEQAEQQGLRQTGDTQVVSMTATDYTPDPANGYRQVALDACLDASDVDILDPSGKSVLADVGTRHFEEVVMRREPTTGAWKVIDQTTNLERSC